jgi:hypothetical protein
VIEEMAPAWVQQRTMSRIAIRCSFRVMPALLLVA